MLLIFNALQSSLNGGIGRYSYELAHGIYKERDFDMKIVIREEDKDLYKFAQEKDLIVAKGITGSKKRNLYEQIVLPYIIRKNYPEAVVHCPDTMAPFLLKNKTVITVHDLAFKTLKNTFTFSSSLWKNLSTDITVKKAEKIIAITNFTKSEIYQHYPKLDKEKISVVYNGFNDFSKEEIKEDNISSKILSLKNKYILTVSTISPRKNINGLIEAFNLIKDKAGYDLVIAGNNGWMYEEIYELVDKYGLNGRVIFTGKVNDDELKFLYKNAAIFAYVSFYEGFGLPPLEAMSYGVPCVVSNAASIPEVVGDAAIKADPNDINEIAEGLLKAVDYRGQDNEEVLARFSWGKCAKETMLCYSSK